MRADERARDEWLQSRSGGSAAPGTHGHTGAALLCFLILGVLLAGLVAGVLGTRDDDALVHQLFNRPRTGAAVAASQTAAIADSEPTEPSAAPTASTIGAGTSAAGNPPRSATAPGRVREHVIERGDTLFALALRYGTTVDAIMAANNISDRTEPLRVGRALVIPPG